MLKFLRNKIQSLTETQLNILTAVLVLINIGIVIFWISFFIRLPKPAPPPEEKPPLEERRPMEEILKDLTAPEREEPISEEEKQKEKQRLEKVLESLTAPKK